MNPKGSSQEIDTAHQYTIVFPHYVEACHLQDQEVAPRATTEVLEAKRVKLWVLILWSRRWGNMASLDCALQDLDNTFWGH